MEDFILDVAVKALSTLAIAYFLTKAVLHTRDLVSDIRNEFRNNAEDEDD